MSQPTIIIVKTPDELQLALFRIPLLTPRIDGAMRMIPADATVRATIERNQQQRTRLFGADQRQDAADRTYQTVELLLLPQNRIGRKQHRVKFATHDVALQLQTAVLPQRLPGQLPIRVRHPFGRMVTLQRFMKSRPEAGRRSDACRHGGCPSSTQPPRTGRAPH